jgi:enoyl-CoA hydratase
MIRPAAQQGAAEMTSDTLTGTEGSLGRIRLNRPKAINALTLPMIQHIQDALDKFENDPALSAVLISGEGERGLCAGGDIRALYDHGRSGFGEEFFTAEYRMNAHIAAYKKPYVAIMDGITMGGGVGLSSHGAIRIVTERTRLAMPETGIGFFPDVGGTWLLGHAPGELGTFLGLTGESFGGADAIYVGLADHFVESANIPALIEALAELPASADIEAVRSVVEGFSIAVTPPLAAHRTDIDLAFAFDTVEEIFAALARSAATEFAQASLAVLARKSPTSMKVTLRLLRLGRHSKSLEECLQREFDASHAVMKSAEFYEGVRAAVVDKDRNPKWNPATLREVSEALVASYFVHEGAPLF